jgi:hypothetical protein
MVVVCGRGVLHMCIGRWYTRSRGCPNTELFMCVLTCVSLTCRRACGSLSLNSTTTSLAMTKKDGKKDEKKDEKNSKWSDTNNAVLVQTLTDKKANSTWADNNPKKTSWTVCKLALRGSKKVSGGVPKTVAAIKNRWHKVSLCIKSIYVCTSYFFSAQTGAQYSEGTTQCLRVWMGPRKVACNGFHGSMEGVLQGKCSFVHAIDATARAYVHRNTPRPCPSTRRASHCSMK